MTVYGSDRPDDASESRSCVANILIVCTGNVCRSAYIERYLRVQLDPTDIKVSSAGTGALVGNPMDERTAVRAVKCGADCSGFMARQLAAQMVRDAALVLAATRAHRARVATLEPKSLRYCFTVREFASLVDGVACQDGEGQSRAERLQDVVAAAAARRGFVPPLSDEDADIVDPYRQPDEVYDLMEQQILSAMPPIVRALAG